MLDQAAPVQEPAAACVQRVKLAERIAPGRGVRPRAIAVMNELPKYRAASFCLLQRLPNQLIGQVQRFLVRHLAYDRASRYARRDL